MNPYVTILLQCHNFQRRLCWMLSSLRDQPVCVDVAHFAGNGNPSTEQIIAEFQNVGMHVRGTAYRNMQRFELRGLTRSDQLLGVQTPWTLFADSDMVYRPNFFADLFQHLDPTYKGMYTAGRYSQPNDQKRHTRRLVERNPGYHIAEPFERASALELVKRSDVGAGFFQLLRTTACGGYYVMDAECNDWRWTGRGQKARSDRTFRKRIGLKRKLPREFSTGQIHLNHVRDNQAGRHVEEQR